MAEIFDRNGFDRVKRKVERLTQSEAGCISYNLYSDVTNPENFYFLGIWKNQVSLDVHNQTDHVLELKAAIANLAHSIEVTRLARLESPIQLSNSGEKNL